MVKNVYLKCPTRTFRPAKCVCSITENTWRSCGVFRTCRAQNTRSYSHLINLIERVWVDKHTNLWNISSVTQAICEEGFGFGWNDVPRGHCKPCHQNSCIVLTEFRCVIESQTWVINSTCAEKKVLFYWKTLNVHHSVVFYIVNDYWLTCSFIGVVVMHFKLVEKISNISSNWKSCHLRKFKSLEKYNLIEKIISNFTSLTKLDI